MKSAIYRCVQVKFWTDSKVVDDFTPEDKYFYLYLFTNPHTNLTGCYEASLKQMSDETGYNKDTIERLLDRFKNVHHVIDYSKETKEILILNWHKYNWTKSPDFQKGLMNQINVIKNTEFKNYLLNVLDGKERVYRGSTEGVETSVTVTNTNTDTSSLSFSNEIKEIIDYLNLCIGSRYTYKNESNNKYIRARLNEGFTVDDFKMIIDKKCNAWKGTEWEKFLRPETLFIPKHFESYLNERVVNKTRTETGQRDLFAELRDC